MKIKTYFYFHKSKIVVSNLNFTVLVSLAQLVGQCIIYVRFGVRTPATTKEIEIYCSQKKF